jgi:choline dehydrogenase-like flavoprotein
MREDGHMSVLNGESLAGQRLQTDFCVIGGGPAGIVVASELAEAGHDVVVLEAGSDSHDSHSVRNMHRSIRAHAWGAQADTRGINQGNPYFPLRMSRVRGVGGSARALKGHGLRSRPLDEIDFESRVGAAWPIPYGEFAAYIADAAQYCGIPESKTPWDAAQGPLGDGQWSDLTVVGFRHGPRDEFRRRGADAGHQEHLRWVSGATVTRFEVDSASHIAGVHAATNSRSSFTVEAHTVILATGGIDNARLLLANEPLHEHMGEASEHVGRYFMEHLHYVAGHLIPRGSDARSEIASWFEVANGDDPWLALDDGVVRQEGLARTTFAAVPAYSSSLDPGVNAFGRLVRSVPFGPFGRSLLAAEVRTAVLGARKLPRAVGDQLSRTKGRDCFAVTAMSEQTPNADSRVTLSDRRDRNGIPLPVLDWQLNDLDINSARRSAEILGGELATAGLGDFVPTWGEPGDRLPVFTGGWHHMGTTRMSVHAGAGVVDGNCRVHGVPNLFVAGSSVFVTGGFANPTLTLVALAIRLGRHLVTETS